MHAQPGPATLLGQRHTCAALHRAAPTVATAATASRLHTRQKQQGLCHPKHTRPSLGPHCLPQGSILQLESCLRFEASVRGDTLGNVPLWSSRLPLQHRLECLACSCHRSGRVRRQGAAVAVGGRTIKEEGEMGWGPGLGHENSCDAIGRGAEFPLSSLSRGAGSSLLWEKLLRSRAVVCELRSGGVRVGAPVRNRFAAVPGGGQDPAVHRHHTVCCVPGAEALTPVATCPLCPLVSGCPGRVARACSRVGSTFICFCPSAKQGRDVPCPGQRPAPHPLQLCPRNFL